MFPSGMFILSICKCQTLQELMSLKIARPDWEVECAERQLNLAIAFYFWQDTRKMHMPDQLVISSRLWRLHTLRSKQQTKRRAERWFGNVAVVLCATATIHHHCHLMWRLVCTARDFIRQSPVLLEIDKLGIHSMYLCIAAIAWGSTSYMYLWTTINKTLNSANPCNKSRVTTASFGRNASKLLYLHPRNHEAMQTIHRELWQNIRLCDTLLIMLKLLCSCKQEQKQKRRRTTHCRTPESAWNVFCVCIFFSLCTKWRSMSHAC